MFQISLVYTNQCLKFGRKLYLSKLSPNLSAYISYIFFAQQSESKLSLYSLVDASFSLFLFSVRYFVEIYFPDYF